MFSVHDRFMKDYVSHNLIFFLSPEESWSKFFDASFGVPRRQNVKKIIMERKWILSDKLYVAEKLREMTGARRNDVFSFLATTAQ